MGFLSKMVKEIGRPFNKGGFFYEGGDDLIGRNSTIGKGYRGISDLGENVGDKGGIKTEATKDRAIKEAAAIAVARKAAHDSEVQQLSQSALGAVAMRRRRGMYASMFTGTPALSAPSTGKTLLSQ